MQQLLNTILGSTVIAGIAGALLAFRLKMFNKKFDYEEKKIEINNQKLLEIYRSIEKCVYQARGIYDINNYLYQIKECIDIRGKNNEQKAVYVQDVYIWKCIEKFENGIKDKDEYIQQKKLLQEYILIKRQSDIEKMKRSLKEVNVTYKIVVATLIFAAVFIGQYIFCVSQKIEVCIIFNVGSMLLILIENEIILNLFNDIQSYKEKKIIGVVKFVIDFIVMSLLLIVIIVYQLMMFWIIDKELVNNIQTLYYKNDLNNVYVCGEVKPYILKDYMIITANESQVIVHFVEDNTDLKKIYDEDLSGEIIKKVKDVYKLKKMYYQIFLLIAMVAYMLIVLNLQICSRIWEDTIKNILKK